MSGGVRRTAVATTSSVIQSTSSAALRPVLRSGLVRRHVLAPEIARAGLVRGGIEALRARARGDGVDDTGDGDGPIFVFSAGWGSGSTLVQRLLISSGDVLIWGEPMDIAVPLPRLAATTAAFSDTWPPPEHFREDLAPASLAEQWIANLAPDPERYREAHRAFLESWLGADPGSCGYRRWGLKEVRLTIEHALYLKWVFPSARFLFVYRDIYASYLSIRRKPWTSVWPDHSATNILAFAHHWELLLRGFVERHGEVDGMLVRYEDLIGGRLDLQAIARHVGLDAVDESVMRKRVGGRSARRRPLVLPERIILDAIAGELRRDLGYR